jgi:hypothetical protein
MRCEQIINTYSVEFAQVHKSIVIPSYGQWFAVKSNRSRSITAHLSFKSGPRLNDLSPRIFI